jgi:hypothetical protein
METTENIARLSLENFIGNYIDILSKYANTRNKISVNNIKNGDENKCAYINICSKKLASFKKRIPICVWCDTVTPEYKPRFALSLNVSKADNKELLKNIPDIAFLYDYDKWKNSRSYNIDAKYYRRFLLEDWCDGNDVYKICDKTNNIEKNLIEKSVNESNDDRYLSYFFEESETIDAIDEFFQIIDFFSQSSISDTTKTAVIQARRGQGLYRQRLMEYWDEACAVTNCSIPQVLKASHAKPWAACGKGLNESEKEKCTNDRLSEYNGFLLSANLDALFDKGLITFDNDGHIKISKTISDENRKALGIDENMKLRKQLDSKHFEFLHYHQEHIWVDRE